MPRLENEMALNMPASVPPLRLQCFKLWIFAFLAGLALCFPALALAQDDNGWRAELKTKYYFNSRTSYQFGNPYYPGQNRLSKLEFDMDSLWVGFGLRKSFGRIGLGAEFLTSLAPQKAGRLFDSDWGAEDIPTLPSNYSETQNKLQPSLQFSADIDLQIADLLRLPQGFKFAPVAGFRLQHLVFVAASGVQYNFSAYGEPTFTPLPGRTIAFVQDWYQFFGGLRAGYEFKKPLCFERIELTGQADLAYATGVNRDRHLMRGDRVSYERTDGVAWHVSAGINIGLRSWLDLGLEYEHLGIQSKGNHRLAQNGPNAFFLNWSNGVQAWSYQNALSLKLGVRF